MTKRFREILFVAAPILAFWAGLTGSVSAGTSESVHLETFKTHSRLSFRVDDGVPAELKSSHEGFELYFKGIGLADLGAPLGDEGQWAAQFQKLRDPRLTNLKFAEVAGGLKVQGQWKYPEGAERPANPLMESFDYREKASAQLVIDFWVKEGPSLTQVQHRQQISRRLASIQKQEEAARARAARLEAREAARIASEDVGLFCRAPLDEDTDVILKLLPIHERVNFARWFPVIAPDQNFSYYAPTSKDRDAQFVRLALSLYKDAKYALVNRTVEFFEQECPESTFRSEMRFLRANSFFKLGMAEEAQKELKELLFETKGPPVALHTAMFLAAQQYSNENYLGALESFLWLTDHYGDNRQAWVFHLGAAECARALKQTDRAAKEYQWVAENAPDGPSRAEGALRMGDLYMQRFEYDQGLAAYAQGLRHFKKESENFPTTHINRAEALYGLGELARAADAYRDFLERFPSHPAGWRATYRLGEIEARKEGASRQAEAARKWYFDTVNRFPFSPGATLARMRLLPCGDHAGLNADAARRFYAEEAEKFSGGGEVVMDLYKDYRALAHVRTLLTLAQPEQAVATSIEELRRLARMETRKLVGGLLSVSFRKSVLTILDRGAKLEALTFYQKHADETPKAEGGADPAYLLRLSQSAADLGLGKLAQELNLEFEKVRRIASAADSSTARGLASGHGASTKKEGQDDPEVRMEASERSFTRAKALWVGTGMPAEEKIRESMAQVDSDSPFSYEREIILGLMDEKHDRPLAALRHAVRAQLLGPPDARIDGWTASLEARAGDPKAALSAYRALEKALPKGKSGAAAQTLSHPETASEILGVPPAPGREAILTAQSETLEKQGHWGEAASNYARVVESGLGGSQALYGYARALLKTGSKENRLKAIATLEKLAALDTPPPKPGAAPAAAPVTASTKGPAAPATNDRDKFWRKLASETLANEKTEEKTGEAARSRDTGSK